jgi:hypothetical protein
VSVIVKPFYTKHILTYKNAVLDNAMIGNHASFDGNFTHQYWGLFCFRIKSTSVFSFKNFCFSERYKNIQCGF